MPGGIREELEAIDRVRARIAFGVGEAEAAINVQIVDAQFLQRFAVLERLRQIISDEIIPQRKHDRPSEIERQIVAIPGRETDAE